MKRMPFTSLSPYQADPGWRKVTNADEVIYRQHLSEMENNLRHHNLLLTNMAVIAAFSLTKDSYSHSGSYSNLVNFIKMEEQAIIEIDPKHQVIQGTWKMLQKIQNLKVDS